MRLIWLPNKAAAPIRNGVEAFAHGGFGVPRAKRLVAFGANQLQADFVAALAVGDDHGRGGLRFQATPFLAPGLEAEQQGIQVQAFFGQAVFVAQRALAVGAALHDAVALQALEARGQQVRGHARLLLEFL